MRARVQHRHRMDDVPCTVRIDDAGESKAVCIEFDEPQDRVATGQVAAIWDGEWCLGCGIISDVLQ